MKEQFACHYAGHQFVDGTLKDLHTNVDAVPITPWTSRLYDVHHFCCDQIIIIKNDTLITVTMSYVFHFWYIYIQIIHDMKCIIFFSCRCTSVSD